MKKKLANDFEKILLELSDKLNEVDDKYTKYKEFEYLVTGNCINPIYDKNIFDSDLTKEENLKLIYSNKKIKLLFKILQTQ
jgi:hypothetical protein